MDFTDINALNASRDAIRAKTDPPVDFSNLAHPQSEWECRRARSALKFQFEQYYNGLARREGFHPEQETGETGYDVGMGAVANHPKTHHELWEAYRIWEAQDHEISRRWGAVRDERWLRRQERKEQESMDKNEQSEKEEAKPARPEDALADEATESRFLDFVHSWPMGRNANHDVHGVGVPEKLAEQGEYIEALARRYRSGKLAGRVKLIVRGADCPDLRGAVADLHGQTGIGRFKRTKRSMRPGEVPAYVLWFSAEVVKLMGLQEIPEGS